MNTLCVIGMSIDKSKDYLHLIGTAVELRTFSPENLTESYLGWLRDPNLMRFSNQRFRTHTMESCRAYMSTFATADNLFVAIYHKSSFIGTMTAYRNLAHGTADIGLLVSPSVQGKGLGKDAWITLMTYLLTTGTRKVTGGTLRCNVAMVRIMESSGMHPDGVRVGQELIDGKAQDILHFAKFA
jgi:RimJ/RimL family protein N-acetyltransferase